MISSQTSTKSKHLGGGPGSPYRVNNSRCSFSRNWLLHVAAETIDVANRGYYTNGMGHVVDISEELEAAKKNSIHYHDKDEFHAPAKRASTPQFDTKIFVIYGTSLQVAAKLRSLKGDIGILNSASSRNPGEKFIRGTVSQEDCICRASLLHPCLLQFKDKPDHYVQINSAYPEGSSSSCAIFAPRVPIYREDSESCPVLDTPQFCSILSMPAPNAFEVVVQLECKDDDEKSKIESSLAGSPSSSISLDERDNLQFRHLIDRLYDRLFRALCIFHDNDCRHLVLCAFGCGVHGNDPEMVAEIFKLLLDDHFQGMFETVVFSIQPSRTYNFDAFIKVFPSAQTSIPHYWSF